MIKVITDYRIECDNDQEVADVANGYLNNPNYVMEIPDTEAKIERCCMLRHTISDSHISIYIKSKRG